MKDYLYLAIGILVTLLFIYGIYRFLPLGLALVCTGGYLGAVGAFTRNKIINLISMLGAWLWPIGVVITFFQSGWKLGLVAIVLGVVAYRFTKRNTIAAEGQS